MARPYGCEHSGTLVITTKPRAPTPDLQSCCNPWDIAPAYASKLAREVFSAYRRVKDDLTSRGDRSTPSSLH